jgi:thiol-disulfide isomerase/thioredoxin
LADLTDGEDIFRKIVEPYRGRFIYLDVWGTWCAPCKEMMKYVPQMKEQLKDLDIVYLFLASRSNEEPWKTAIAQFHLTGENCIHYNLPDKQQSALERYIGVGGYPTYKIVAPNGNLLPTEAPRPNHPEAIRNMIEKLKDNK